NWSGGTIPAAGDDVVFDGATSNNACTMDLLAAMPGSIRVKSNYTATITLADGFNDPSCNLILGGGAGNLTLEGGTLLCRSQNPSASGGWGPTITAGNLVLASGALISADAQGFGDGSGPGTTTNINSGGSHGGVGGGYDYNISVLGATYDNAIAPGNLGSGGERQGGDGGGAIRLIIANASSINGERSADGQSVSGGGGAGGSIHLQTGTRSGSGAIGALGGTSTSSYGGGGGGRIAVVLSGAGADFSAFTGSTRAYGGVSTFYEYGAAGTVYLETQAQGAGAGNLIIDNNGYETLAGVHTALGGAVDFKDFGEVIIRNKGNLAVEADDSFDFSDVTLITEGAGNSTLTLLDDTGVVFPDPFSFSGYTLALNGTITASGDWTLVPGGNLSHNRNGQQELQTMHLDLNGNLTVQSGALITAKGMGHAPGCGPGLTANFNSGGSYGGRGGDDGLNGGVGTTYGNIIAPGNIGSGGRSSASNWAWAGGAIRLSVSGNLVVNGEVDASAFTQSSKPANSGGSVFISCGALSGSGNIRADGGASGASGAGGGGRIAVVLSSGGSDFSSFTGRVTAYGGDGGGVKEDGAAGTIYLETPAQGAGAGNLIIDNNNLETSGGIYTLMPATVNLSDFGAIILRNGGDLAVDADDLLDFSSVSIAGNGQNEAFLSIVDATGVTYPASFSIAGYTLNLLGDHTATGNWTVTNTGAISHCRNGTTELYKTHLTLSGNLTVENG
ncbi:MAG: hypothetical protein HQL31_13470, partial [Planctomycetes bacterium]|nr:hypothetical protein [Planctomycetota bacterium]